LVQRVQELVVIIRIAFTLIGGRFWTGGYNYLLNVLRAMDAYVAERVRPILFVGNDVDEEDILLFRNLDGVEVIRSEIFNGSNTNARLTQAFLYGKDRAAERIFEEHAIDVVFEPAAYYGWRFAVPAIAWVPDFQHRHLPEMFERKTYWKRELRVRAQVATGRHILLSSEDARRDCEKFYPGSRGRTSVVRFAVIADIGSMVSNPAEIASAYGLPKYFFYLPNQFWKHKNHALVIEAIAELRGRGKEVVVAVSGKQEDPYNPGHYKTIEALIQARGVSENFRILGMIPHDHLYALMRSCSALINPSLCEGWSTTVEEAKSLGVPMLLSDLSVHREQVGQDAKFFDPGSVKQLADLMSEYEPVAVQTRKLNEEKAIESARFRVEQFALDFEKAIEQRLGVQDAK